MRGQVIAALLFSLLPLSSVYGHFQELIPSSEAVHSPAEATLSFDIQFTHPMARGPVMTMQSPEAFGVVTASGQTDLLPALKGQPNGRFSAEYQIKSPGDHLFYLTPAPYWEPEEGVMIQHFTKVVVDAFGGEPAWDQLVGLPVEIEPLTRPYGIWQGNLFQGIVKKNGQPVPFAEVEVEWRNDGSISSVQDPYVTQVVKADGNGVFSYVMPKSGWWGFAALITADKPMRNPEGVDVPVEQGALIWIFAKPMQ
ncbi:DUF4198 domain-containing protein [Neptunomonas sp. XY-337]|uniref:DUF4198 domain-containing protein n=1 Tax=Neptunomonas sp. XY-337 TaxID=2561897 RepID=UPI0010AB3B28|nr:DUF4198 domain-containing protein [Neptunomonas sp. XY-337]